MATDSEDPALPSERPNSAECRCECGSLVARRVAGGVEIKCRGCKRLLRLSAEALAASPLGQPIPLKPVGQEKHS